MQCFVCHACSSRFNRVCVSQDFQTTPPPPALSLCFLRRRRACAQRNAAVAVWTGRGYTWPHPEVPIVSSSSDSRTICLPAVAVGTSMGYTWLWVFGRLTACLSVLAAPLAPAPAPHTPSPEGVKSCDHTTWSAHTHPRLRHAVCPGGKGVAARRWLCAWAVTNCRDEMKCLS